MSLFSKLPVEIFKKEILPYLENEFDILPVENLAKALKKTDKRLWKITKKFKIKIDLKFRTTLYNIKTLDLYKIKSMSHANVMWQIKRSPNFGAWVDGNIALSEKAKWYMIAQYPASIRFIKAPTEQMMVAAVEHSMKDDFNKRVVLIYINEQKLFRNEKIQNILARHRASILQDVDILYQSTQDILLEVATSSPAYDTTYVLQLIKHPTLETFREVVRRWGDNRNISRIWDIKKLPPQLQKFYNDDKEARQIIAQKELMRMRLEELRQLEMRIMEERRKEEFMKKINMPDYDINPSRFF